MTILHSALAHHIPTKSKLATNYLQRKCRSYSASNLQLRLRIEPIEFRRLCPSLQSLDESTDHSPTRWFASSPINASSVQHSAKIFSYSNENERKDTQRKTIFSKLTKRQSAELEDELLGRLNNIKHNKSDARLVDPIIGKLITRKGLDWVRSISIPSAFSFGSNNNEGVDTITVDIHVPTLLHPQLETIASYISQFIQEETALLIKDDRRAKWSAWEELASNGSNNTLYIQPSDISVRVKITPNPTKTKTTTKNTPSLQMPQSSSSALQNVTHFLAVYSCKGGVGKSSIATNLAYELSSMGGRVGLVDLDVYGPSLPLLVRPDDPTVRKSPPELGVGMVEPIEHRGVKLMSLGYVSPNSGVPGSGPDSGAAVLRGPMAGRVAAQLLKGTNWGNLDVLVLDLPPGTGDVQLEACQSLSLSGAVAVSTPSSLAWADVKKGVQMFGDLGVPTLALVENMAYFVCEGGGRHYPFGKARSFTDEHSIETSESSEDQFFELNRSHVFQLPISLAMNESNDSGTPLCCDRPSTARVEIETFTNLAKAVSADLLLLQHGLEPLSMKGKASTGRSNVLTVTIDEAGDSEFDVPFTQLTVDNSHKNFTIRLFSNEGGFQKVISGVDLRSRDPKTGERDHSVDAESFGGALSRGCGGSSSSLMVEHHTAGDNSNPKKNKDYMFPAKVSKKGNYGYEVEWADGAVIIYSLKSIAKAAGGKPTHNL
ncbi:hypothetical protein ACHAXS_006475 [Conticribra weissflogii]